MKTSGGERLADCLVALGADTVFGLPGIHALGAWEGLRSRAVRTVVSRTEICAGFAADGYARVSGRPAPLLLSTGPGALNSLTALMESASSHVPIVAIVSQIPREHLGRGRGYLHELRDQLGVFAPVVKWTARVPSIEALAGVVAAAWREALRPPSGPVVVEIPVDVLTGEVDSSLLGDLAGLELGHDELPLLSEGTLVQVASRLARAERPVIWAGGGVLRSDASEQVVALAERLGAPVATTYMGKGVISDDHELAAGCGCDEAAFQELLESADVVVCIGTELGAETTSQYGLRFAGETVQIDAAPERFSTTYPVLGVVGDARVVVTRLLGLLGPKGAGRMGIGTGHRQDRWGQAAVAALRGRIRDGLARQGRELELGLLRSIEAATGDGAVLAFDMTILGYWAAPHMRAPGPRRFLYPLGSGTLGYAWPAALGASVALEGAPVLAVVGDGGFAYSVSELATAAQYGLDAALLVIDDGAYSILREYQMAAYGRPFEVELHQPDFAMLSEAYKVPVKVASPTTLESDLKWALATKGPAVVVLREQLVAATPTL